MNRIESSRAYIREIKMFARSCITMHHHPSPNSADYWSHRNACRTAWRHPWTTSSCERRWTGSKCRCSSRRQLEIRRLNDPWCFVSKARRIVIPGVVAIYTYLKYLKHIGSSFPVSLQLMYHCSTLSFHSLGMFLRMTFVFGGALIFGRVFSCTFLRFQWFGT